MSLDIVQVAPQLEQMLTALKEGVARRDAQLSRVRGATITLPEGSQNLRLDLTFEALEPPIDFVVLATDGSQIDIDRNAPASYYLINVGEVFLRYGSAPGARLSNHPSAKLSDESLVSQDAYPDEAVEEHDRVIVALERAVAEIDGLLELASSSDPSLPTLALADGTLALWTFGAERFQPRVGTYIEKYVATLKAFRELAVQRPLSLASYISYPGSREITRTLQLDNLLDRQLFSELLERTGQRSSVFMSRSRMQEQLGTEGPVHFFYMNAGPEIGRIEVPPWVAEDPQRLSFVHTAVFDQCRRNFGYPVALMEAHEQAVISEADRQAFRHLVEQGLESEKLATGESMKSRSKRVPWA